MLQLDAEALYSELRQGVRALLRDDSVLVGIWSGGAWLAERLPRYMVPRYLEACAAFPKTPSERVEKYRLLERGVDRPGVAVFEPVKA